MSQSERPAPNPLLKLAIEAGPLAVFFLVNRQGEQPDALYRATAAFMAATVVAVLASWRLERRLPIMPLVSGGFVLVFGGLTLAFANETFIKVKPTLVNLLLATTLFVGLALGRPLLKPLLGSALQMRDEGWRTLTLRWACFFVFLAGVNEVVWRSFSTEFWAGFKLFGIMPATILFTLAQVPLLARHQEAPEAGPAPAPASPDRAQDPS